MQYHVFHEKHAAENRSAGTLGVCVTVLSVLALLLVCNVDLPRQFLAARIASTTTSPVGPVVAPVSQYKTLPAGSVLSKSDSNPLFALPKPAALPELKVEVLPHLDATEGASNLPTSTSTSTAERFTSLFHGTLLTVPLLITLFGLQKAENDTDCADNNQWKTGMGALAGLFMFPAMSLAAGAVTPSAATAVDSVLGAGFVQAFSLIFLSEVGDKTFFIAGLLAVKYSKLVSYVGSMGALAVMSVIAAAVGQIFHAVPTSLTAGLAIDDYAAIILFAYFGVQTIRDASELPAEGETSKMDEELEEAEEVVEDFSRQVINREFLALLVSTFSLVFAAEFGDKSFLATIGLSAAQNPVSVTLGAVAGHGIATALAVATGSFVSQYLSERVIGYIGGTLFITFAATTFLNVVGVNIPAFG
jgi:putative Ca2+/H+ antiporter (TMEM165/GDT1 family)|mmetsp:Transcript_31707/g.51477  ORF Transcript_31707/g.51477 Transcript_31707/m.51477 type:complete len:417 (+) Transcript_31707:46-1296(+)